MKIKKHSIANYVFTVRKRKKDAVKTAGAMEKKERIELYAH